MKRYNIVVYFNSELDCNNVEAETEEEAIDLVREDMLENFSRMKFSKVDIKVLSEKELRGKNVRK